jgi:uncharacterized metal-binding protein
MSSNSSLERSCGPKLIFACSGAADVGEIADRAARCLTSQGVGKMFCVTGVGGRVDGIMKKTESASKILAIDGCELECVKNCLQQAGFTEFEHLRISDMGMEKGKTTIADENIATVAESGAALLS